MKRFLPFLALSLFIPLAAPVVAQNPGGVVFATYYECDQTREADLDDVVMEAIGPIYQKHVDAGHLTNWGWSAHNIGGAWRRLAFMIAPDRATVLQVRSAVLQEVREEEAAAGNMIGTVCPTHEDYIWSIDQVSQVADANAAPSPSMTTYYSCNAGSEARADEIIRESVAPVLEDMVREGHLNGWSWLVHQTGGWFRRALVMGGESHASIFDARDMLLERLADDDTLAEFGKVCGSHVDYNWNPVTTN
jgi:hypothetical protein